MGIGGPLAIRQRFKEGACLASEHESFIHLGSSDLPGRGKRKELSVLQGHGQVAGQELTRAEDDAKLLPES